MITRVSLRQKKTPRLLRITCCRWAVVASTCFLLGCRSISHIQVLDEHNSPLESAVIFVADLSSHPDQGRGYRTNKNGMASLDRPLIASSSLAVRAEGYQDMQISMDSLHPNSSTIDRRKGILVVKMREGKNK